jgi:hypothetical protein
MSDAQDIRAQRAQDAQDLELKKAQTTAQQMAAQAEQQRIFKDSTIRDLGYNPVAQSDQALIQDPKTGVLTAQNVPGGLSPGVRYKKTVDEFTTITGRKPSPEEDQRFLMQAYGMTGSPMAGMGTPKPVTLKGPDGKPLGAAFIDGKYYDADGKEVQNPEIWQKPVAEPKPGAPRPGLSQGKNVFGFFNPGKKQWQDAAGNALPDFQPQPSFAETGLFEPMASYNPETQSIAMGSFNRRTGALTFANGSGASVPLPPAIAATIGKEFGTAREAQTRLRIMQQNAAQAYQGNQQAMVSLLMNHIGMTLGAQKGTRVAKSIIDEARQSAPWVDAKLATIGHQDANGDFIFDGLKGGINLTGGQVAQMVDLAKQRNDLQWQQVKDTGATYGVDLSGAIQQTQSGTAAGTTGAGRTSGGNTYKQTATGPNGHKIGSNDGGNTWFDVKTGKKI